jgi:tetraacyldisaccharide 4'-kinase
VRFIERIWSGTAPADALARAVLSPLELVFRSMVAIRGGLYDSGILRTRKSPILVISIGNLTVGGTGKTPVAAWIASHLVDDGRSPAIILRGYGGDETIVHKFLNPTVPIIEATDRVSGIQLAADSGADIAILDDAFQHRRAARDVDIVLVSADDWSARPRLLPAGPYREPPASLSRASMVIITRKIAADDRVSEIENFVRRTATGVLVCVARLQIDELVEVGGAKRHMEPAALAGKSVLAVAGIGNPGAFVRQLESAGARVTSMEFPDHHAFTVPEISEIARRAKAFDYGVCTLKDAVKLGPRWPADAVPLWYVSLSVNVERGEAALGEILTRLDRSTDI